MSNEHFDAALPINWSVDDTDGPIQGPLALAFLQGRRLALTLGAVSYTHLTLPTSDLV